MRRVNARQQNRKETQTMTDNREEIKARIQNVLRRYEESQRQPRRRRTRSKKGEDTVVQIRGALAISRRCERICRTIDGGFRDKTR